MTPLGTPGKRLGAHKSLPMHTESQWVSDLLWGSLVWGGEGTWAFHLVTFSTTWNLDSWHLIVLEYKN